MDILWRSEDQHVNHINYTPSWKHRWSSNKEKSAGFAGNLNHIFLKTCSVESSRYRNACTDCGETCHVASLRSLFPEVTAVISRYKLYRDQQSSGNRGNMRQPSMLKWSRAAARVWPHRNPNIHCGYDIAQLGSANGDGRYYSQRSGEHTFKKMYMTLPHCLTKFD